MSRPLITKLLNRREIESDVRDNGREMSERKTWLGRRGLCVVLVSFPGASALISRLLFCSVAAHGAHCLGHMKSISRSQRGTPFSSLYLHRGYQNSAFKLHTVRRPINGA